MIKVCSYLRRFSQNVFCVFIALSCPAIGKSTGTNIQSLSQNPSVLAQGQALFLSNCAGCHNKDLSGGVGFNLKDGEWVHGGSPEQILHSLQQGFDNAGMPGFGKILAEQDQHAIVAYILSKREGFADLQYKIYQLESATDNTYTQDDLVKSGALKNNWADFELPEIPHYAIQFSGDFYAPNNQVSYLYAERIKNLNIQVKIDGQEMTPVTYGGVQKWLLNKGKQQLDFTFYSGSASVYLRNIELYVVNKDSSIKLFPVSTAALKQSKDSRFEVKATGQYIVQQKKIVQLPSYSMAIGAPEKLNYAFNTKSCAINGLWQGDLLNVGPNIGGRGKDGSIPLGDWIYHYPAQLLPNISTDNTLEKGVNTECHFDKYRIDEGAPEIYFTLQDLKLTLTSDFSQKGMARFTYRVLDNPSNLPVLTFSLPNTEALVISSKQGHSKANQMSIDIQTNTKFEIHMSWLEGAQ